MSMWTHRSRLDTVGSVEVGIRELKQQLSALLDRAEAGEEVIVTDRGRPKVRIVPVASVGRIDEGVRDGWITPPRRSGVVGGSTRHRSALRVSDVLDDDRGGVDER
jgi:prevent-host-death family protein